MQKKEYPLLQYILQYRKINLILSCIALLILICIVFFVMPFEYTSQTSVIPSAASFSSGIMSSLGGLGQIAGLDLNSNTAQSQEMYMGIIDSKKLLDQVIYYEYEFEHNNENIRSNLIDFFEIDEESDREISEKVLKKMREDVIVVNISAENNILYLDVTTENPYLSAQIANRIIYILNDIVQTEVHKEYRQKLEYLQTRLVEFEDSLRISEIDLKTFLETNTDPSLPAFQVRQLRLRRQLQIQTELLVEYRKQLEIFIADNMINMADIKVLDVAYPPYRKSRPKRILLLITFSILYFFLHLGIVGTLFLYRNIKLQLSRPAGNE